jgi:glutamate-1-semialdehyde 2,1-aminomutase
MERVAPSGPVYQAGTLSGNPLAMAAGLATLEVAQQPGTYEALDRKSALMVSTLTDAAAAHGIPFSGDSAGGMWGVFFHDGPVTDFAAAKNADTALYSRWHAAALDRGVFLAPSAFEAAFVSTAHDDDTLAIALDRLTAALADAAHA